VESTDWVSGDVDLQRPSVARVYDYYLGGSHNFAVDREFAEKVIQAMPDVPRLARENRAFLRRAVRDLCNEGIDQFVDLGSGIPTEGNVHEVAQAINPEARVVYVDWDPVAFTHGQAILAGQPFTNVVRGDLREPEALFASPEARSLIDLSRPVVVLLIAVLHFIPDEAKPGELIRRIGNLLAPGSYLVISHASPVASVANQPVNMDKAAALYSQTASPVTARSQSEIAALFGDFTVVEPGVVPAPLWRPDFPDEVGPDALTYPGYAGVARI
jgi:SAM-dependent methyltransferase